MKRKEKRSLKKYIKTLKEQRDYYNRNYGIFDIDFVAQKTIAINIEIDNYYKKLYNQTGQKKS